MFAAAAAAVGPHTVFASNLILLYPKRSSHLQWLFPDFPMWVSISFFSIKSNWINAFPFVYKTLLLNEFMNWEGTKKSIVWRCVPTSYLGKTGSRQRLCSVAKLCLTLGSPIDCSTPGSSVLHCLPEFAQTSVHWVSDAIRVCGAHSLLPQTLLKVWVGIDEFNSFCKICHLIFQSPSDVCKPQESAVLLSAGFSARVMDSDALSPLCLCLPLASIIKDDNKMQVDQSPHFNLARQVIMALFLGWHASELFSHINVTWLGGS